MKIIRLAWALVALVSLGASVAWAQGARPNGLLNRGINRPGRMGRTGGPTARSGQQAARAGGASAGGGAAAQTSVEPGGRSIEFNQTPVDLVFKVYGELVDKTVLRDPQLPNATITLQPKQGQELTDDEKIQAIEAVLEMNGIHFEPYGDKFVRAMPRKEVRKEGVPLLLDADSPLKETMRVVSLMIPFRNISVEDAQKALDNFKSANGIIIGFERTNQLLLTDTEQNVNRMREIAREIDIATPVLENVFVRQIKYASAEEVKTALQTIVEDCQKELEKNGKAPQNTVQQQPTRPGLLGGLRRPGQQQPQAPVANSSLVVTDADRGMIRGKVLILSDERSNKLVVITQKSNMDFFDKVIEQLDVETTPDTVVKVYRLKYAEAEDVSDMINDLIGNSQAGKSSSKNSQNANAKKGTGGNMTRNTQTPQRKPANQRTGETKAGELTKDNTTVLADKRINGIVVMTEKDLIPTIEKIIESMDIKLSQVLIETTIIEVQLGDDIKTGMDWVQKGRSVVNATDSRGKTMSYRLREYTKYKTDEEGKPTTEVDSTWTQILGDLVPSDYSSSGKNSSGSLTWTDKASDYAGKVSAMGAEGAANYFTAGSYTRMGGGQGGTVAGDLVSSTTSNLVGKAFNFIFSSDELGLTAILQASKSDSRTKYIASPIIMTLDNKEATIEATQMRYLFKGYQYSGSANYGSPVPDYEQKELGITIKVTPKINPNGTVMLTLEEEYSQMGGKQAIAGQDGKEFNAENTVTRKMSADALLENNQTVVFAGLTETTTSESETGIPILKDIPWIGKWLFGTVENSESRSELLVFMTPYVLDDAEAAQAEALRRKKAISDQHAWDDHGWSASKLADPVSRREQMKRLKDEWKKQDEERAARQEIEQAKIDRVKQLEKMGEAERKKWLEIHKEELKEEERKKLEEQMLDKDSQEKLKKLAAQIREKKLKEANTALEKADKEAEQLNERAKLDAAKKKAKDGEAKGKKAETEAKKADVEEKKAEKLEEVKPKDKVEEVKPPSK